VIFLYLLDCFLIGCSVGVNVGTDDDFIYSLF